jgi:DNA-binding YbaB/EbfC family protein
VSLPGFGALGSLGKLAQLPAKLKELQARLAGRTVEGSAGGGLVRITATGTGQLTGVSIDPEVLAGDDREMLEDLIVAAANQTLARAKELAAEEMQKEFGGMIPPGLVGDLGIPGS